MTERGNPFMLSTLKHLTYITARLRKSAGREETSIVELLETALLQYIFNDLNIQICFSPSHKNKSRTYSE